MIKRTLLAMKGVGVTSSRIEADDSTCHLSSAASPALST